jgi:phosphatidylglycerophosphatase A
LASKRPEVAVAKIYYFLCVLCALCGKKYDMKRLLASCFGLGWLPLAPGSWGSLPPTIIFGLLCYVHAPALLISIVMAALALYGSIICIKFVPAVIAETGKPDPGEVVADEIAGQAITFLATPFFLAVGTASARQVLATTILGFLLFRAFDAIKPWPIHKLEKLREGWGVLVNDLMASVYAAIVLQICVRLWIAGI